MTFERYHEAVDYLQRYLWQELPILAVERAMQERIRTLLAHFGDPHRAMPVVHVGGSAGKGSTATMVASILRASGLRTGLYTSPHLQTFIERIDVNGQLIGPDRFAESVLGLDPLVRQMHLEVLDGTGRGRPSLVEVAFAVGMRHFAEEHCDAAVVEVGLGGRTDCTNVFDAPAATVITNVELEHRERLGPDVTSIAREKAAIIKSGIVVTGARRPEALDVIEQRCNETGATLWRLGQEIRLRRLPATGAGSDVVVRTPLASIDAHLPLSGAHQARNAALAVAAAQAFGHATGRAIADAAMVGGLAKVTINGRMEVMQRDPVVILDAAHNPVEARALATTMRETWLRRRPRLLLVCGILGDKERAPIVSALTGIADRVIVTRPPLEQRAGDERAVESMFVAKLGRRRVACEPEPEAALERALSQARLRDIVLVTGSMFLVGALRSRWVSERRILERRSSAL